MRKGRDLCWKRDSREADFLPNFFRFTALFEALTDGFLDNFLFLWSHSSVHSEGHDDEFSSDCAKVLKKILFEISACLYSDVNLKLLISNILIY